MRRFQQCCRNLDIVGASFMQRSRRAIHNIRQKDGMADAMSYGQRFRRTQPREGESPGSRNVRIRPLVAGYCQFGNLHWFCIQLCSPKRRGGTDVHCDLSPRRLDSGSPCPVDCPRAPIFTRASISSLHVHEYEPHTRSVDGADFPTAVSRAPWERQPPHIARSAPSWCKELPGVGDIDEILTHCAASDVRIVRARAGVTPRARKLEV